MATKEKNKLGGLVRKYFFVLRFDRVLFIFFMFLHPLEKELPVNPLHPSEISGLNPPSPLEFPVTFRGGGMDIFWNHTFIKTKGKSCYF